MNTLHQKMKKDFVFRATRQSIRIFDLDPKVISVIWIAYCNLHLIGYRCAKYEHSSPKMKVDFLLEVVWQIILYVTLTSDSKVIAVIWIYYCYLHPTGNRCVKYDRNECGVRVIKSFGIRVSPLLKSTNIKPQPIEKHFTSNIPAWAYFRLFQTPLVFDTDGSKEDSKVSCAVISDNHSNIPGASSMNFHCCGKSSWSSFN